MSLFSKLADVLPAPLRAAAIGLALAATVASAGAAPVWQQTNDLSSWLGDYGTWTYAADAGTRTGTVTYTGERAYNNGPDARHMGMYIGWNWSYQNANGGPGTPLLWDNGSQTFVGGGISMTVERLDATPQQYLRLADVVDDTWIGNPWSPSTPGFSEPAIATVGSWEVPFFDFGVIAAGGYATYDIQISLTFDDPAVFDEWNSAGSFYVGGQGVQVVPEPATLALAGLALLAAFGVRRRG